jgi:predicted TIM-barrel fold metal-dependent hydrolase
VQLTPLARSLYEEICTLPVVDAHEHLPAEADYLAKQYSGLNMFAGGYIWHDLESAGLPPAFKATMRDGGYRPVEGWWPVIRPYWEQVKYGSYARALRTTVRDLWGLEDVNDATIGEIAGRVQADNAPGLYRRVLQERCGIRTSITNVDQAGFPNDPGLRGIVWLLRLQNLPDSGGGEIIAALERRAGHALATLNELTETAQAWLRAELAEGAIGFKMFVAEYGPPDAVAAERAFRDVRRGTEPTAPAPALRDYLFDKCLDVAAESGVPVAVHAGYWGDFRKLDPGCIFSYALRRRDVRFDLYHLGMPMVHVASFIGKVLPNVSLNLTWCPVISQTLTARTLSEVLDLVPLNKVSAFGGDYRVAVHKVYGHLTMAREVVAAVLAERVQAGDFDRAEALRIAKLWMHDNPARVYALR